jgi:hydroxymethylpyrimidine pyrophosphatase-like HAD family hydrolase
MDLYDVLYQLYQDFDTGSIRDAQDFVDLFPPVDSRVALGYWESAQTELIEGKQRIEQEFEGGTELATIAATADRKQAFTALDLYTKYNRRINALVLDVDETLRSAGETDNEIPRETLHQLTRLHESGIPIIICTGQTLENVKGFAIQGLGNELVHSGQFSIVYEAGTGVFTPGKGTATKQLLYESLEEEIQTIFRRIRAQVLSNAPSELAGSVHLQGNEFNITLKPNFDVGSEAAASVIDRSLIYLIDLLGTTVTEIVDIDGNEINAELASKWARAYYSDADGEIATVLTNRDKNVDQTHKPIPPVIKNRFDQIDVAYYHADAAEIGSLDLDKPTGVQAALESLAIEDPFVLVMGDSKSDLRIMRWVERENAGIVAAPRHASTTVVNHVTQTDNLVYEPGDAASILRSIGVLNRLAAFD